MKSYRVPISANPDPDNAIVMAYGEGDVIFDENDKEYVDLSSSYGIGIAGHRHPRILAAMQDQMKQLLTTSTLFTSRITEEASKQIALRFDPSGNARMYWESVGAMCNEAGFKCIFEYQHRKGRQERKELIVFGDAFSGRTERCLAYADNTSNREGFNIEDRGIRIPFNDIPALLRAVKRPDVAGIFVEPVQGEGGINVPSNIFMQTLRDVATRHDIPLMFDEVQAGFGRIGHVFAYEHFGIQPDLLTCSKGPSIGSGVPVGFLIMSEKIASMYTEETPFKNGSTHGGNPLATRVALESFNMLIEQNSELIGPQAKENSRYFFDQLKTLTGPKGIVEDVKGIHMMIGLKLKSGFDVDYVKYKLLDNGVLSIAAQNNVLRFLPPLNLSKTSIDMAMERIRKTFLEIAQTPLHERISEIGHGHSLGGDVSMHA